VRPAILHREERLERLVDAAGEIPASANTLAVGRPPSVPGGASLGEVEGNGEGNCGVEQSPWKLPGRRGGRQHLLTASEVPCGGIRPSETGGPLLWAEHPI